MRAKKLHPIIFRWNSLRVNQVNKLDHVEELETLVF